MFSIEGVSPFSPTNAAFNVTGPIGSGGMGVVHSATQVFMDRTVAIKRSRETEGQGSSFSFVIDEGQRFGRLDHPNIPPVHLLGKDDSNHAILVMKLIVGHSLKEMLTDSSHPRWSDVQGNRNNWALSIVVQIARALEHAHSRNILHRDIKTENVMIGDFGQVFLIDWGISVDLTCDEECMTTDRFVGTPCIAAPEMVIPGNRLGPRTDVYLLGAMAYEIITGKMLHTGTSIRDILKKIPNSVKLPAEPLVIPELMAIIQRAVSPATTDRHPSVAAFRADVQQFLDDRFLHEQLHRAEQQQEKIQTWLTDRTIDMESAYSFMTMAHETLALLKAVERSGFRVEYVQKLLVENLTIQTQYAILNRQFGVAKSFIAKLAQELGDEDKRVIKLATAFSNARSTKATRDSELNLQSRTAMLEEMQRMQTTIDNVENESGD